MPDDQLSLGDKLHQRPWPKWLADIWRNGPGERHQAIEQVKERYHLAEQERLRKQEHVRSAQVTHAEQK